MLAGWMLAILAFPVTLFVIGRLAVQQVRFIRYMEAVKKYKETHGLS